MTLILAVLVGYIVLNIIGHYLPEDNSAQEENQRKQAEKSKRKRALYVIDTVDYKQYIRSSKWYTKRLERIKLDNKTCQKCGIKHNLVVHHLTYDHLGDEPMEDLVTLCRVCHQGVHDMYGRKGNYFPID